MNEKLIRIIEGLGYEVEQDVYEGEKDTFFTFTYEDDRAGNYADDKPNTETFYLQIQLFCPKDFNYISLSRRFKNQLFKSGFSYPSENSYFDTTMRKRRVIYKTQIIEQLEV